MKRTTLRLLLALAFFNFIPSRVTATPYASAVNVAGGTVTFMLNEDADEVKAVLDGGASTLSLGPRAKGAHSFNLDGATSFQIVVTKVNTHGYAYGGAINQISSDSNVLVRFTSQRGVAINKNPSSPYFGRVYVSHSALGTNTDSGRVLGDGIYVLNPDLSETALGTNALTGGINWSRGTAVNHSESPYRLFIGSDSSLYISDWSDTNGSLYVTDPNVANGQIVLDVFGGPFPVGASRWHGSVAAAVVTGTLAGGDLTVYTVDEDLQANRTSATRSEVNSLWRYDIGAGPLPWANQPTKVASPLIGSAAQQADLAMGPDGKFYIAQRRAEPATTAGIYVLNTNGAQLWNSRTASRDYLNNPTANDLLGETAAIDVSRDGKWLAVLRRDINSISLLPMTDGIPDMTNRIVLVTEPATGVARDIAFDAANNLYYVSSGQGLLRVFSPGGISTATTASDGTFTLAFADMTPVNVTSTAHAAEADLIAGSFQISRSGDLTNPLEVNYFFTGTATSGPDYVAPASSVIIPAGQATATVTLTPAQDETPELTETVILNLQFTTNYTVIPSSNAVVYIGDNEPVTLMLTALDTNMLENLITDTAIFQVTRLGDTNADVFGPQVSLAGTASENADYTISANPFYIAVGQVTTNLTLTAVDDASYEGDETISISLDSGSGDYQILPQPPIIVRIRENDFRPAPILFSDNFDNPEGSNSWTSLFGANNNVYDATVRWGYDYSTALPSVPRAPGTPDNSTLGLFAAVNKATPASSAGINFYPAGQQFSGDYALRFDMYLSFAAPSTTEHALLGLNHSGTKTNRATQSADANNTTAGGDGIWVGIVSDASNLRDYSAHTYPTPTSLPTVITNTPASSLTSVFTSPPYGLAGSPGSTPPRQAWSQVELSQVANNVTLKVNHHTIWTFTNTSGFTAGNIMIGMNDQFDSVGSTTNFVIFDNLQVVSLAIRITSIELLPDNKVQIDFTSELANISNFDVRSTPTAGPFAWTDETPIITALGDTRYRAIVTRNGDTRFYQVVRSP